MRSDRTTNIRRRLHVIRPRLALSCVVIALAAVAGSAGSPDVRSDELADFVAAMERSNDAEALSVGESILAALKREYGRDATLRAFESRLIAAEFLARQMQQQLRKAVGTQLFAVADEVFEGRSQPAGPNPLAVAPAKRFYETSVKVFSNPVRIGNLADEEKTFLAKYYDLRLRSLTAAVAKAGQALAIAAPAFKSAHDYALVLPLLHASSQQPVNIDALPQWMKEPEQLKLLSDSCLLHFEFPFQAMAVAREAARMQQTPFSEYDFYRSAAKDCGSSLARIAVDCLRKAMDHVPPEHPELAIGLRFDMVQLWLESGNYPLAAGEARAIFETYPRHSSAGKAIWLYYYALSRSNNTEEILVDIDEVLTDDRCKPYEPKLMYIKWWALRRRRDQSARVAALEYELLRRYGDDPMVAPILLSRATDLLASQSYNDAYDILNRLAQQFPSTRAATQAKRMLERLKATNEDR